MHFNISNNIGSLHGVECKLDVVEQTNFVCKEQRVAHESVALIFFVIIIIIILHKRGHS